MVFSSPLFLFLFLPVVLLAYFLKEDNELFVQYPGLLTEKLVQIIMNLWVKNRKGINQLKLKAQEINEQKSSID